MGLKIKLTFNEFAFKKTKDYCKLDDKFEKQGFFTQSYICKITDKKNVNNKV
jgi:hypothetical protein